MLWKRKKEERIHLFGDFTKAHVFVGEEKDILGVNPHIDPEAFEEPYFDAEHEGTKFRFVNPNKIEDKVHVQRLKKNNKSFVFDGDLDGVVLHVSNKKIEAQELQGPKTIHLTGEQPEPLSG